MNENSLIAKLRDIIRNIGDNPTRQGLVDTPKRIIRSWTELFPGYVQDAQKILGVQFSETNGYDQIILLRDIPFVSHCEHHILPFFGKAHVGYLAKDEVVGASKIPRLVDMHAKRLQIQERMTKAIADDLMKHLKTNGVGVIVIAEHLCMTARGIKKPGTMMVTAAMEGFFKQDEGGCKTELYKMIELK